MNEVNKKMLNTTTDDNNKLKNLYVKTNDDIYQDTINNNDNQDVVSILQLKPLTSDLNPGHISTSGQASSSLTSSSSICYTSGATRLANPDEIREARWKTMKELKKKGYVQIQTNIGNINLEIHCDITPITAWNFITLCNRNYYDNTIFHRLIPNFMIQGGDPTGTGKGGQSAWLQSFKDEIDSRLSHDTRGILSMANSGPKSNRSQFFLTFDPCKHLDLKHTIFGRLVGGMITLNKIEEIKTDKDDRPNNEIKILKTIVFTNPIDEADQILINQIKQTIQTRLANAKILPFPKSAANTTIKNVDDNTKNTTSIGKYVSSSSKVTNESIENFLKSQQQNIDNDNNNLKRKFSDR
jgi:cyclophilin family peptidyl-prolyl cis-trans isomerase